MYELTLNLCVQSFTMNGTFGKKQTQPDFFLRAGIPSASTSKIRSKRRQTQINSKRIPLHNVVESHFQSPELHLNSPCLDAHDCAGRCTLYSDPHACQRLCFLHCPQGNNVHAALSTHGGRAGTDKQVGMRGCQIEKHTSVACKTCALVQPGWTVSTPRAWKREMRFMAWNTDVVGCTAPVHQSVFSIGTREKLRYTTAGCWWSQDLDDSCLLCTCLL